MKHCTKCKTNKSTEDFWKNKTTKDGLQAWCKPCWYKKTTEKLSGSTREKYLRMRKNNHLKKAFNITLEKYEIMLAAQNGVCKICGGKQNGKHLAVDHNHATNKIRGILCDNCNRGLGMFKDNPILLNQAIKYLKEQNEETV